MTITVKQLSASLLKNLKVRFRDIIEKRYGLKNSEALTLEAIGQQYKVSRERIRQIEAAAFRELRKENNLSLANNIFSIAKEKIASHCGAITEDALGREIMGQSGSRAAVFSNHLRFVLGLSPNFIYIPNDEEWNSAWIDSQESLQKLTSFIHICHDEFVKIGEPVPIAKAKQIIKGLADQTYGKDVKESAAWELLEISKIFGKNPFNEVGLVEWREINPKSVRDKAYIVLKKHRKPLHFRAIADEINRYARMAKSSSANHINWLKNAHQQTTHNELIKDSRFVLVGRGMYGLKDWGLESGTIKEVLINILSKSSKPMTKENLYNIIAKQRVVQPNTVFLNLAANKNFFQKFGDGTYALKQKAKLV